MRVVVTGGTGTVGAPVVAAFVAAGADVHAVARSDESAARLGAMGATPVSGSIERADELGPVLEHADVVVHAAYTFGAQAAATDLAVIRAVGAALRGTDRCFVYTSGLWVLGDVGPEPATEDAPVNPPPTVRLRPAAEEMTLALAASGVRGIVIRPGVVHGDGTGLLGGFVADARRSGVVRFVGTGDEYWPMVHRSDLGELYRLAALRAEPGTLWHGVTEPGVLLRDLARAAAAAAGVPGRIEAWPVADAVQELGDFAYSLALDQTVSGERARRELGWRPTGPTALEELARLEGIG